MNRIFSLTVAAALALALVGMGMGVVAAGPTESMSATQEDVRLAIQEQEPENESANESDGDLEDEDDQDDLEEQEENETVGTPIDENVRVASWRFEDGMFSITLANDGRRPVQATISESTQGTEGANTFSIQRERLLPGETTITMSPRTAGEGAAAVTITTPDSIDEGRGVEISTGQVERNPLRYFGGQQGLLAGMGMAIAMSGLAAAFVLWREEKGVIKA